MKKLDTIKKHFLLCVDFVVIAAMIYLALYALIAFVVGDWYSLLDHKFILNRVLFALSGALSLMYQIFK